MTHPTPSIVTDVEIQFAHGNAEFPSMSKRKVVDEGVLKCALGIGIGTAQMAILLKHKLIVSLPRPDWACDLKLELTPKGKYYLAALAPDVLRAFAGEVAL